MGAFTPSTLLGVMAAMHEPYVPRGPYSMPRGQSVKNRKASKPKKAKRKQAAKARKKNRR